MPFEDYVERKVFAPLNMTHATFRQPLPASLAPFMAKGYRLGSLASRSRMNSLRCRPQAQRRCRPRTWRNS